MSYLPDSVVPGSDALNYRGTWNPHTNVPALASGVGVKNDYYVCSHSGHIDLDGNAHWFAGEWVVFDGTVWVRGSANRSVRGRRVILRPGATTLYDEGVYGSWEDLMHLAHHVDHPVTVEFDDDLGLIEIPAGTHTFPVGSIFAGHFDLPFNTITFKDGAVLEGVRTFEQGLSLVNESTSPVIVFDDGVEHIITFQRGCSIVCPSTAPFVQVDGAGTLCVMAFLGGELISNVSNTPIINAINGGTAFINPVVASPIPDNVLGNDATSPVLVQVYGDTSFSSTQVAISGPLIVQYPDEAKRIAYDNTTSGLVATLVQDAIDELANKHVNSRSTAVSGAGTTALAAGGPKLVLVDMTGAGAGVRNIDLPDPAVDSGPWKIKRVDANGAATVNIRGTAGANVDGAASQPLGVSPASANLETDGTDWYRI